MASVGASGPTELNNLKADSNSLGSQIVTLQKFMTYITHRSKVVQFQRCPRSRYLLHEAEGTGYTLIKSGVDLIIGAGFHEGAAAALQGCVEFEAVDYGLRTFDTLEQERGFQEGELKEQRFLTEGLIRLCVRRVIPRLLEFYQILEIEHSESHMLSPEIQFAFTPDALMRQRSSGDLYVLSWKTAASLPKEGQLKEVRVDMQGITETWGLNQSFKARETNVSKGPRIRGVQMVYLVKGRKVDGERDSPLIRGWQGPEGDYASSYYWRCSEPHKMARKSKYYPTGECPGDGRRHERKGDWVSKLVAEEFGVENWMNNFLTNDDLDEMWTLGVPIFRRNEHIESYMRQVATQETRVMNALERIRIAKEWGTGAELKILDEEFPQNGTSAGCRTYNALCPAYEICFGSQHIGERPLESGIYQPGASLYEWEDEE